MKRRLTLFGLFVITLLILTAMSGFVLAESELNNRYMTLKNTQGRIITRTGHQVVVGDEYLNSQNDLYRVIKVQNDTAIAKLVKKENMSASLSTRFQEFWATILNLEFLGGEVKQKGPIVIYHTHSDESYIRGDGTSSKKANGGIFQVGDVLTSVFEKNGIPVVHSKTPHDPHDAMSYDRSRRTAIQFLKDRPITMLDIHRDAVPAYEYAKKIGNEGVTKVQLVVGRQNPNFQANNDFAKQIKATVDQKYPGLVKGIFYGKGKYNQDLGPKAILLEFGSDKNSKISAEKGAQIFAVAAKDVLYGAAGSGFINRGSIRSVFWIVVVLIAGVGLFLLLNHQGLKDIGKEFTGAIGEEKLTDQTDENEKSD